MRNLFAVLLAGLFALGLAGADPIPNGVVLQSTTHDGISLDFTKGVGDGCCYVKAPGQPAQRNSFQNLFTFTRNSPWATFHGSNGLIQYANENQLQQSQTLDNAYWTKTNATITADTATAPDGTATADKLVEDGTISSHQVLRGLGGGFVGLPFTASAYLKSSGRTFASMQVGSTAVFFNLTTGATGTVPGGYTAGCWDAGNSWWRCYLSGPNASNGNVFIYTASNISTTTYQGDSSSGILVWGMQAQAGRAVGPYLATVGAAKYDQPRIEFGATGPALGLLVEGARTNIALQSEALGTTWVVSGSTISSDATAAPDGNTTADKIVEGAAGTFHLVRQDITVTANTTYTYSHFLSPAGRNFARLQYSTAAETSGCFIDVNASTGAIGTATAFGTATGCTAQARQYGNSFWRFSISGVIDAATTTARVQTLTASALGTVNYSGDGSSGVNAWGGQLELGAFASSYIPTTTAGVARAADYALRTPLGSEYNALAGTVVSEWSVPAVGGSFKDPFWLGDNSTNQNAFTVWAPNGSGNINTIVFSGGASSYLASHGALAAATSYKSGIAASANNFAGVVNGGTVTTDTSGPMPVGVDRAVIGSASGPNDSLFGHIRRLDYWPERKSELFLVGKTQPGLQQ